MGMTMSKSMNTLGALAIAAALAAGLFICLLLIVSCGQKPEEIKKDAFAENAETFAYVDRCFLSPGCKFQAGNSREEYIIH